MILTFIAFIAFVVLTAGVYMCIKGNKPYNEALMYCGFAATLFGIIAAVVMVFLIIGSHNGVDVTIEKNRIEYESLCERYELIASEYEDISKSDIIKEITVYIGSRNFFRQHPDIFVFSEFDSGSEQITLTSEFDSGSEQITLTIE